MPIKGVNLRNRIERACLGFEILLAEVLIGRPDLSHARIQKEFEISQKVIRRVIRQFNIGARECGPKPGNQLRRAVPPCSETNELEKSTI